VRHGTVIIGAAQAGVQIAASLRDKGYDEPITLIGAESHPPYQRPPLSKTFLTGDPDPASLHLRGPQFYANNRIELVTGTTVTTIDRASRQAVTANGRRFAFDDLALTTGTTARPLAIPGAGPDIAQLRSLDDAWALRPRLAAAGHVAIIGGGFIGLEVAAVAAGLGKAVTVIEAQTRLLARTVAPPVSAFLLAAHGRRGVDIRLGTTVERIEGPTLVLADGGRIAADLIVAGIGALPRTDLAAGLGLDCAAGIPVDDRAQTLLDGVLAAGDCTVHGAIRLESVQNAIDQGKAAAATIMGRDEPNRAVPWFWSDQGKLKLQVAGLSAGYDRCCMRGDPEEEAFSVLYYAGPRLIAVDSINRPADHLAARRLIAAGAAVPPEEAVRADVPLKTWIPASPL